MSIRIVGVDPGVTTGIVLTVNGEVFDTEEARSLKDIFLSLKRMKPDVLVVEIFVAPFRYRSRNTEGPFKAIGVCELYAEMNDILCVRSNPAILQGRVRPRGMSPHLWAARVHALHYWEKNASLPPKQN